MSSVIAIRHVPFEDLDGFESLLASRGYNLFYRDAAIDDLKARDVALADLVVILGGPIGANEEHWYPFLRDELALIETRLARRRPTLGLCLGAQLMARALSARVYPAGC